MNQDVGGLIICGQKKSKILFVLYKLTAQWLPISQHSSLSKKMREFFGKRIAEKFGRNVNIERNAFFYIRIKIWK